MTINPLNDISRVYLEQISESAVPGKPAEKLGAITAIPQDEREAARRRTLEKSAAIRAKKGIKVEALDPVGKEDDDLNNNGIPNDKSDKYLKKRRTAINKAISTQEAKEVKRWWDDDGDDIGYEEGEVSGKFKKKKKAVEESFSNWREDLKEIVDISDEKSKSKNTKLTEKDVDNYSGENKCVTIGPNIKEEIKILDCVEIEEKLVYGGEKPKPKDSRMTVTAADKAGNTEAWKKYKKGNPLYKAADHLSTEEKNPYAIGMSVAMKSTGDKPPLKKSTIVKAHKIAKKVEEQISTETEQQKDTDKNQNNSKQKSILNRVLDTKKKLNTIQQQAVRSGVDISNSYEPEGEVIGEEMPKKAKGSLPSGTRTFTGMGYYGRTSKEKKNPKSMKRIFPEPKEDKPSYDDENPPRRRYRDDHPSLTARERNSNLR
jgi:hypothetical protein